MNWRTVAKCVSSCCNACAKRSAVSGWPPARASSINNSHAALSSSSMVRIALIDCDTVVSGSVCTCSTPMALTPTTSRTWRHGVMAVGSAPRVAMTSRTRSMCSSSSTWIWRKVSTNAGLAPGADVALATIAPYKRTPVRSKARRSPMALFSAGLDHTLSAAWRRHRTDQSASRIARSRSAV